MKQIITFILDRTKERSTWLGIISLIAAFGVAFSPEQKEAIVTAGVALVGVIATFTKDKT